MKNKKKDIWNNFKNKDTGFMLPENYFSEFGNSFQEKINKLDSGFTSPENYFETIEDKVLGKVKNTGFKTPDNYFQNIDNKILIKIERNKNSKVINLTKRPYFRVIGYSIAASLLLFFGLNNFKTNEEYIDFDTLEIAEIESWMDDDLISFSSFDIADAYSDISLSGEDTYSDEEIIDYLENLIIENLIIENLIIEN